MTTTLHEAMRLELQLYRLLSEPEIDLDRINQIRERLDHLYAQLNRDERRVAEMVSIVSSELVDSPPSSLRAPGTHQAMRGRFPV